MARSKPELLATLKRKLPRRAGVLVAVSGGVDSLALLHGCCSLERELDLRIEAAHLDHGLRPASSRDAAAVGELCARLGVRLHHRSVEPPASGNIEEWGRRERYRFFFEILSERELRYVLTAHTADDVAETLLMRLISNKEARSIEELDRRRRCLRPLLSVTKELLSSYASANGLVACEDESNRDVSLLRNRVRHKLIPLLRDEFEPRIGEILASRAEALAEDLECLYGLLLPALSSLGPLERGSREWLSQLRRELGGLGHEGLRWRLVEQILREDLGFNLGRARSREALEFFTGSQERIELPGGLLLEKRSSGVSFTLRKQMPSQQ